MKDAGLRVRVEKQLREDFGTACRLQGRRAADVLREFMRDFADREFNGRQGLLFEQEKNRVQQSTSGLTTR